jgi:hypothetical protein
LREIFSSRLLFLGSKNIIFVFFDSAPQVTFAGRGRALAA